MHYGPKHIAKNCIMTYACRNSENLSPVKIIRDTVIFQFSP